MHDIAGIAKAVKVWNAFQAEDPKRHAEKLSQSSIILAVPEEGWQFYPLRHLWTWLDGVPFDQSGGRALNAETLTPVLHGWGLARVSEHSPFFEAIFQDYSASCGKLGKTPGKVHAPDPRTSRVFWVAPGSLPSE